MNYEIILLILISLSLFKLVSATKVGNKVHARRQPFNRTIIAPILFLVSLKTS